MVQYLARLRALFRRESVLRDIEEELRVHVEMETETNIKRGVMTFAAGDGWKRSGRTCASVYECS